MKAKKTLLPDAFGEMELHKGLHKTKMGSVVWKALDVVPICTQSKCVNYFLCPYDNIKNLKQSDKDLSSYTTVNRCVAHKNYILDCINFYLSVARAEEKVYRRIGLQLLPLQDQYYRLYLAYIGSQSVIVADFKGGAKVHPVLREIREVGKRIILVEKACGLSVEAHERPNTPGGPSWSNPNL